MTGPESSLRARRRRQTTQDIHQTALRLAAEHGFGQVTVDMISAEAGISRRTFFNYFSSREAAVIVGPRQLPEDAVAEFLAGTAVEPAQVLRDLTRLVLREFEEDVPAREDLRQVMALAREHASVLAVLLANFDAFEREVAGVAARRIGQQPEDEVPALLASLALSAIRTGLQRFSRLEATGDSPLPHVERSIALLHSLLVP